METSSKMKSEKSTKQYTKRAEGKIYFCNNYLTKQCPLIAVEKPNNVIVKKIRHRRRL